MIHIFFKTIKARPIFILFISLIILWQLIDTIFETIFQYHNSFLDSVLILFIYLFCFLWIILTFKKNNILMSPILGTFNSYKSLLYSITLQLLVTIFSISNLFIINIYFMASNENLVQKVYNSENISTNSSSSILSLITVIIIAPIIEEFIFRGFLFSKWTEKMGAYKSMILTSLIFSILHINFDFIGLFLNSILFCILYMKTKNLFIPIICHMFNNFIGNLGNLELIPTSPSSSQDTLENFIHFITKLYNNIPYFLFFTVLLFLIIVYLYTKILPKNTCKPPYTSNLQNTAH